MNPELQKLWTQVLAANKAARSAGEKLSPADVDEFLQAESEGKFGIKDIGKVDLRNLGRSFMQGLTLNFADELAGGAAKPEDVAAIEAAGNSVVPGAGTAVAGGRKLLGKISEMFGGSPDVTDEMRLRGSLFHAEHPKTDIAANIAGAVAPALLTMGESAPVSTGMAVARGAGVGAGTGMVAGAGAGETADERLSGAGTGAVVGGAFGAAIPGIAGYIKSIRNPALRARAQLRDVLMGEGGVDAAKAKNASAAAAGKGGDVVMADMNDMTRALADWAATNSDKARSTIERTAIARQGDQSTRLLGDVPNVDADAIMKTLKDSRRTWAKSGQGYGGLRAANPDVANTAFPKAIDKQAQSAADQLRTLAGPNPGPGMQRAIDALDAQASPFRGMTPDEEAFAKILTQPKVKTALNDAKQLTEIGSLLESRDQPSFEKVFHIKERVEAAMTKAYRAGDGGLGGRLKDVVRMMDSHLIENVPGYDAVTMEYAKRMGMERAVAKGVEMWNKKVSLPELQAVVTGMQPQELSLFRQGLASSLRKNLTNSTTNLDEATKLLNASIAKDAKLKMIFGNQQTFDQFVKGAEWESDMAKLRGTATGSPTARRTAAGGNDPGEQVLQTAATNYASSAHMAQSALARLTARRTRMAMQSAKAAAQGPLLMTRGTSAIDALLESLRTPDATVGGVAGVAAPMAAGAAGAQAGRLPF